MEQSGSFQTTLVNFLLQGSVSVPVILLQEYKQVGLTEKDVMILIHLINFQEKEWNPLPSIQLLESRMHMGYEEISNALHHMVQHGFIELEDVTDENGLQSERYSLTPLYRQLAANYIGRQTPDIEEQPNAYQGLFQLFEREFGRALSPFECETLSRWIDDDGYSDDLIEAALREAVFCGKVSFRYIDRILLEWERNQIQTSEQAFEYTRRFRSKGVLYKQMKPTEVDAGNFSFYNWVSQE
ncbi:DnaD domain-containing protein [Baia soyae]|uniref:DNA replication protein DnaD n=1 Tax=Baia soyae TaxID=1544746 RepID=A0A4R2RFQ3_9BACL|nr:DnaD domain-containing protein [Baia soyae]TCP61494.1 DNA replication protein DnaD [Baia soyae]